MSIQFSITLPDDVADIIQMLVKEKGRSQSAIVLYLIEKGIPSALEETNKLEITKKLIAAREEKEAKTDNA
ncbi:ribbon-helix-helix protein, CopG family [Okeania sp. SIO1I7]|uniref:ribbon-helix-helix protein, CopG family n=1 Tax=Okeania sp. SIO1I7 TaxID=2607772 RepID=UPI0013FC8BAB|nr:ribbon-helix-helix protein, CopG family [Okeania sp. SIO1I7]NET29991.1 ribbon-helix-helix protein, CopG family [Okeania sp. SIO1I7]